MDIDQIVKKVEWLDSERRRDKDTIAMLQELMEGYQRELPGLQQELGSVSSEIAQMKVQQERFDQIEGQVSALEVSLNRKIEDSQARLSTNLSGIEKEHLEDLEELRIGIGDVKKRFSDIRDIQDSIDVREAEDHRLAVLIQELEQKLDSGKQDDETFVRTVRMLEEGRRQDVKRLVDLQAESNLFRKRLDEQRGKLDLWSENLRKYEQRLTDLKNAEKERKQEQISFFEKLSLKGVEQTHEWNEVLSQFEGFQKKFGEYESKMASLSVVSLSLERSQETFNDVNDRLERRVHELTEMQRLSAERMRQDWEGFIADDQKRWANFLIKEEERQAETAEAIQNFGERLANIEVEVAKSNDAVNQLVETEQDHLKKLSSVLKEWLD